MNGDREAGSKSKANQRQRKFSKFKGSDLKVKKRPGSWLKRVER